MSLAPAEKSEVIVQFARSEGDTGSPEVQVALLTTDIKKLALHFEVHAQDKHSRRGLLKKVAQRRKLLDYLKKKSVVRYQELVKRLSLRK